MELATLAGTLMEPVLLVRAPFHSPMNKTLKTRRGCSWDAGAKAWRITGPAPRALLAKLRVGVDERGAGFSVDEATAPVVFPHPVDPAMVVINPRLTGAEHVVRAITPLRVPDAATGWVEADALDLAGPDGRPLPELRYVDGADTRVVHAWDTRVGAPRSTMAPDPDAILLASSFDPDDPVVAPAVARVSARFAIPDWFGLALYPYQRLGALAVCAGHRVVADPMGLGKTRTALAAVAALGKHRAVVVAPPVAQTEWCVQACDAHLGAIGPQQGVPAWVDDATHPEDSPGGRGARVVSFTASRKAPALPPTGVVVVTDSLLVSRPALLAAIEEWGPDAIVVDEAHRCRSWSSKRSTVVRGLARAATTRDPGCAVIALTGTPHPSGSPTDLAPLLDLVGMLDPVYGGLGAFVRRYAVPKFFTGFEADPDQAPRLARTLDTWVRVRRRKTDVLPWLPAKSRVIEAVDPDMGAFRAGVGTVEAAVSQWAHETRETSGRWPDEAEVFQWAKDHAGLGSTLRIASAMAKIEWCASLVCDRLDEQQPVPDASGAVVWEEPQLVWCWHKDVMAAVAAAIRKRTHVSGAPYTVTVLDGSTTASARDLAVKAVQERTAPVTVCQIAAMGVGVTMTSCWSPIFLETDWLPDLNAQAEDRCHRPGQAHPVEITVGWAPGTTDDHLFCAAAAKARGSARISHQDVDPWPHPDVSVTALLTEVALNVVDKMRATKPRLAAQARQDAPQGRTGPDW